MLCFHRRNSITRQYVTVENEFDISARPLYRVKREESVQRNKPKWRIKQEGNIRRCHESGISILAVAY